MLGNTTKFNERGEVIHDHGHKILSWAFKYGIYRGLEKQQKMHMTWSQVRKEVITRSCLLPYSGIAVLLLKKLGVSI